MELYVMGKKEAAEITCEKPWAAIQISSARNEWPDLHEENRIGVLQMQFLDTLSTGYTSSFNKKRALQIWEFVGKMWDQAEVFLIHCEMGISRSSAIAAAIHGTMLAEQQTCEFFKAPYDPNRLVYKTMIEVAYGDMHEFPS